LFKPNHFLSFDKYTGFLPIKNVWASFSILGENLSYSLGGSMAPIMSKVYIKLFLHKTIKVEGDRHNKD